MGSRLLRMIMSCAKREWLGGITGDRMARGSAGTEE